jgi:hypothetical protein
VLKQVVLILTLGFKGLRHPTRGGGGVWGDVEQNPKPASIWGFWVRAHGRG